MIMFFFRFYIGEEKTVDYKYNKYLEDKSRYFDSIRDSKSSAMRSDVCVGCDCKKCMFKSGLSGCLASQKEISYSELYTISEIYKWAQNHKRNIDKFEEVFHVKPNDVNEEWWNEEY